MKKRLIGLVLTIFMLIVSSQIGIKPASARVPAVPPILVTFISGEGKFKNEGTWIDIEVEKGESVPANKIPEVTPPDGAIFDKWFDKNSGEYFTNDEIATRTVDTDAVIYEATFKPATPPLKIIDITFKTAEGEFANGDKEHIFKAYENKMLKESLIGGILAIPSLDGHDFDKWRNDETGDLLSNQEVADLVVTKPTSYTATYKAKNSQDVKPNKPSKPENKVIKTEKKKEQLPSTGSLTDMAIYGSLVLLSGLGLVTIAKKKEVEA